MSSTEVRVKRITPSDFDKVMKAANLFDHPLDKEATHAFLADQRHHLLIAFVDEDPAGMVTAVELLHPDRKRPEMFLYELGVDPRFRRGGVATALLRHLIEVCHERGCGEMFVLTDESNVAAMATYGKAGGGREPDQVMLHWDRSK